jgi:hypothetical protein
MLFAVISLAGLAGASCGGPDGGASSPADPPPAARAAERREPSPDVPNPPAQTAESAPMSDRVRGPVASPVVERLEVTAVDQAEGEDGHGQIVPARRAVALDVIADAWPGRALDPVLHVGQGLVFRRYGHPGPGVLRFVAADADALPAGAPVYLQWGDDDGSRVEVSAALEVPR